MDNSMPGACDHKRGLVCSSGVSYSSDTRLNSFYRLKAAELLEAPLMII
jgi:hypothetical protein